MTEVNLLPPELQRRQQVRRLTMAIIAGSGLVVLLLLMVFLFESARLSSANDALAEQNAVNAGLQSQIDGLQQYANLENQLQQKKQLVTQLEAMEVEWSGVMHDLSSVIPSDVYVTQVTGTVNVTPGSPDTLVNAAGLIGTIQFQGVATDHPAVAQWLNRLVLVDGWVNAWVAQESVVSSTAGSSTGVQFTGTIDLSTKAAQNGVAP